MKEQVRWFPKAIDRAFRKTGEKKRTPMLHGPGMRTGLSLRSLLLFLKVIGVSVAEPVQGSTRVLLLVPSR